MNLGILSDPELYPTSYEDVAIRMAVDEVNAANMGIKINLVAADPFVPETPAPIDPDADPNAEPTQETPVAEETETPATDAPTETPTTDAPIETPTDEPTAPVLPESAITSLLTKGVHAILSPKSLGITEDMVKELIAAKVPLISTATANPESYNWVTQGLYINATPTSRLLGQALAEKLMIDGKGFIGLLRKNNFYSTLIKEGLDSELVPTTGQVIVDVPYAADTVFFNGAVDLALAKKPPTLVLLSDTETTSLLNILLDAGYPAEQLVFVGANAHDYAPADLTHPLTGAMAISSDFTVSEAFQTSLNDYLATLSDLVPAPSDGTEAELPVLDIDMASMSAAARAYDSVKLLALATLAGNSLEAKVLGDQLRAVSGGDGVSKDAIVMTDFKLGAEALFEGKKIDFDGISGGFSYERSGEPRQAIFTIYHYDEHNVLVEGEQFIVPNEAFIALLPKPLNDDGSAG
ncbi:MAG: hypothetical protein WBA28_05105 [Microbacteriaceae bacterium]